MVTFYPSSTTDVICGQILTAAEIFFIPQLNYNCPPINLQLLACSAEYFKSNVDFDGNIVHSLIFMEKNSKYKVSNEAPIISRSSELNILLAMLNIFFEYFF